MYNFSIQLDNNSTYFHYGISNIELKDGFFGLWLRDFNDEQLKKRRETLIKSMQKIVLYSVKVPVCEYEQYSKMLKNASALKVENFKISLSAIRDSSDETIDSLRKIIKLAEEYEIKILFEASSNHSFFNLDMYKEIRTDYTGLIFSPLEYIKQKKSPVDVLKECDVIGDICFVRANDGLIESGAPTLPGKGDADIKSCAKYLLDNDYKGYFSFADYSNSFLISEIIRRYNEYLADI